MNLSKYQTRWSHHCEEFYNLHAAEFSREWDQELDKLLQGTGWEVHSLLRGNGTAFLDLINDRDGVARYDEALDDRTAELVEDLMTELVQIEQYHDPFPMDYRGRYA